VVVADILPWRTEKQYRHLRTTQVQRPAHQRLTTELKVFTETFKGPNWRRRWINTRYTGCSRKSHGIISGKRSSCADNNNSLYHHRYENAVSDFFRSVHGTHLFALPYSKCSIRPPPAWTQASARRLLGIFSIPWNSAIILFRKVQIYEIQF
jgi:hypothetical protein